MKQHAESIRATSFLFLPMYPTADLPEPDESLTGALAFDTTLGLLCYCTGLAWEYAQEVPGE